jgi:hypothetical protein
MPAFDVAALLERRRATTPEAASPAVADELSPLQLPNEAPAGDDTLHDESGPGVQNEALDQLFNDDISSPSLPSDDARASQPLGRLALQRVQRAGSAPDIKLAPEPPPSAARAILKSMTGEMAAVPSNDEPLALDMNDDALDRMLAVEAAPLPSRGREDVLDDILGDLVAGNTPPSSTAASSRSEIAPVAPPAPVGIVARLIAWVRSLFGG